MSNPFQRRSSWPSSLVTGLIGWNAFILILVLALGYSGNPRPVFGYASAVGVLQVVVMRLCFERLRLHRGILRGAAWGALIGTAIAVGLMPLMNYWQHREAWLLGVALYTGAPVGAFLSYFHRDDQRIIQEHDGKERFGRDAHWLEPFAFGGIIYAFVFAPELVHLLWFIVPVGAMVGVFAAGASHFGPDLGGGRYLLAAGAGSAIGALSGLLFRQFSESLWSSPIALGAASGALTFLVTFVRGRVLARRYGELSGGAA